MTQRCKSTGFLAVVSITILLCASTEAQADVFEVTLEGIWFSYDGQQNMDIELTIDPGDTVRWLWVEGYHNVVSGFPGDGNEGELFFSGPPIDEPGNIFEFTFLEPGVFGYHCHPHGEFGMISFVTVIPAPGGLGMLVAGGLLWGPRRRRRPT